MRRPQAGIAIGATIISFSPVMVKLVLTAGATPVAVAFWRTLLGSALLFGLAILRRARLGPRTHVAVPLFGGIAFAGDLYAWHVAIGLVGSGIATVLGNTQVFWTALMGRLFFGERLGPRLVWGVLLAFAGIALLAGMGSGVALTGGQLLGVACGLTSGFCYACYIVILQRSAVASGRVEDPLAGAMVTLAWVTATSGAACAALAVASDEPLGLPSWQALAWVAAIALLVQVIGWVIISRGLARTKASRAALIILMQPALATLWGWLLFGEHLSPLQLLGAGLTLVGIYLGSRGPG